MGKIEDNICEAVRILIDQAVSSLKLDQTILCTIKSCEDEGLKKYKVKYQDSVFIAYGQSEEKYPDNTSVYVLVPSGDTAKDRLIVGTASKLGEAYINAITAEDKMTKIGNNIFTKNVNLSLCSYKNADIKNITGSSLISTFGIDTHDIDIYKEDSQYIMISADFQTKLSSEQQLGHGDYGLVITCVFHNDDTNADYERKYTINVASMVGQPYKFDVPARQYAIFPIEGDNLLSIKNVAVYSQGFPVNKTGQPDDIFISNFEFWFMESLNEDEIAGTCLHIITPNGAYFKTTDNSNTIKTLQAEIKIKGSAINGAKVDNINYYWFVRDTSITANLDDHSRPYYSSLGGEGWRCLNAKVSDTDCIDLEDPNEPAQFVPDGYKKEIRFSDCPSNETKFKCVAVMEDTVLQGTVKFKNEKANYFISLTSKDNAYNTAFAFETAYNFQILATVLNSRKQDISDTGNLRYYWSFEADGGGIQSISNNSRVLTHDPNIAIQAITYLVTVYDSGKNFLGTAELTFVNSREQKDYNLVLTNGAQVFKYNEEGVSPNSDTLPAKERITIFPISFEMYDRNSRIIAESPSEKIRLFKGRWLWPVENENLLGHNTMLDIKYSTAGLKQVYYNGGLYWELPITNTAQLSFNYNIKNDYCIENKDNNIILEISYQGILSVASTNFTFTKEGELGTNGTKYSVRLQPIGEEGMQQVFVSNDKLFYWIYDTNGNIKVRNFSGRFNLQVWDGGTAPIINSDGTGQDQNLLWEVLPYASRAEDYNIRIANNKIGRISSTNVFHERSTILQGCIIDSSNKLFSSLAQKYYGTYALNTVHAEKDYKTAFVTGGYDHVRYAVNGKRAGFSKSTPFTFHHYGLDIDREYEIEDESEIKWRASWEPNVEKTGRSVEFTPPEQMGESLNNYIVVKYKSTTMVISVHFYLDRYSMPALNGWDGSGIEVDEKKGYILTPQLAAGIKNHEDNTFTGIAIGKTFSKNREAKDEVGLMGFDRNIRTIFLNAEDGSATFGVATNNTGCLQIKPDRKKSEVLMSLYGSVEPTLSYDKTELSGGRGAALCFSAEDNNYLYFGNHFYVKQKREGTSTIVDAFLDGTIVARSGKIGGWKIENNSLVSRVGGKWAAGDKKSSEIVLNANEPSITAKCEILHEDNWIRKTEIKLQLDEERIGLFAQHEYKKIWELSSNKNGDAVFSVGTNENENSYIQYKDKRLRMRGSLSGTNWRIEESGVFEFHNADSSVGLFMTMYGTPSLELKGANIRGDNWYIYKNGSFAFGTGSFNNNIKYNITGEEGNIKEFDESRFVIDFNAKAVGVLESEVKIIYSVATDMINKFSLGSQIRYYGRDNFINNYFTIRENELFRDLIDHINNYPGGPYLTNSNHQKKLKAELRKINVEIYVTRAIGSELIINSTNTTIRSDHWRICQDGSFAIGALDPVTSRIMGLRYTPLNYKKDPSDPNYITPTQGTLHLDNTNIKGDAWKLDADGSFEFGNNTKNRISYNNGTKKFTIRTTNITLQSNKWMLGEDGGFYIVGDKSVDIRNDDSDTIINKFSKAEVGLRYIPSHGTLEIKGGELKGDTWKIKKDGAFIFGDLDKSYLAYAPTHQPLSPDGITIPNGAIGRLILRHGDIYGDNWHILSNGEFTFGNELAGNNYIKFSRETGTMTISANLEGYNKSGQKSWTIMQDGSYFSLGGGRFVYDQNSGALNLTNTNINLSNKFVASSSGDVTIDGNCFITGAARNGGLLLGKLNNHPAKLWRTTMEGYVKEQRYIAEVFMIGERYEGNTSSVNFAIAMNGRGVYCPKVYTDWPTFCKECGAPG